MMMMTITPMTTIKLAARATTTMHGDVVDDDGADGAVEQEEFPRRPRGTEDTTKSPAPGYATLQFAYREHCNLHIVNKKTLISGQSCQASCCHS